MCLLVCVLCVLLVAALHAIACQMVHRHTLKCENEQIIKRNTTETDWEWDEPKKKKQRREYDVSCAQYAVCSEFVVRCAPPSDASHAVYVSLFASFHANTIFFLFVAFILPIHKFTNAQKLMSARNRRPNSYFRMATAIGRSIHHSVGPPEPKSTEPKPLHVHILSFYTYFYSCFTLSIRSV